jgi:hypothetical protein
MPKRQPLEAQTHPTPPSLSNTTSTHPRHHQLSLASSVTKIPIYCFTASFSIQPTRPLFPLFALSRAISRLLYRQLRRQPVLTCCLDSFSRCLALRLRAGIHRNHSIAYCQNYVGLRCCYLTATRGVYRALSSKEGGRIPPPHRLIPSHFLGDSSQKGRSMRIRPGPAKNHNPP